jgi:hypothetical protein
MKAYIPTLVLVLLFVFGLAAVGTYGATLTVTKTQDTNDGICDAADCSLREGTVAAASGDTIVFSEIFNSPQTITLSLGQITIDKDLTISGTGQGLVTISGNHASRILFVRSGITVNLTGITFRDGDGSVEGAGGAIWVDRSTLNITNATFTNNRVFSQGCSCGLGSAIFALDASTLNLSHLLVFGNFSPMGRAISGGGSGGATTTVVDSIVKQNTGGGINSTNLNITRCLISDHNFGGVSGLHLNILDSMITNNSSQGGVSDGDSTSTVTIERCLISGNSRIRPGGGIESSGMTIIRDSQIAGNAAVSGGGGIANLGTLYLINSVVSGNRSTATGFEDGGGGISNAIGRIYVVNSTVSGNTAEGTPGVGGGIHVTVGVNLTGSAYVVNSTIADNVSSGAGGGVNVDPNGQAIFSNSIISDNDSSGTPEEDVAGKILSNGTNLVRVTTGSSGWVAEDLLNVDPVLGSLGNNGGSTLTHPLLPGSPAINTGNMHSQLIL